MADQGNAIRRLSHIGIVVEDLDRAVEAWTAAFGLRVVSRLEIKAEGVRNALLSPSGTLGETYVELMEPIDKEDMSNAIARRLRKSGEGVYHLAMIADDPRASSGEAEAAGMQIIPRPEAMPGAGARAVIHPKSANGVLVELLKGHGG